MKKMTTLLLMLVTTLAHAELKTLDNQALQSVAGQAGADLSLQMSLNQTSDFKFDNGEGGVCEDLAYCHLAISVNKRFVKDGVAVSDPTETNPANKLWLVFKGIQGTINIQKLGLDGIDLVYKNDSGVDQIKPAIQLSFDASQPIQIRNFGFNALSIEQDDFTSYYDTNENLIEGTDSTTPPTIGYGYLKADVYPEKPQSTGVNGTTADRYDTGKERGFMGLQMNGNLALQGKVMMFACDGSHPRC